MEPSSSSNAPARRESWKRAFRPFRWWLPIGFALVAWDVHLRLAAKTRVEFEVRFESKPLSRGYSATFDGVPAYSGQRVGVGPGRLVVSLKDADPIEKKAFIWYGDNDLGSFDLKVHRGNLEIITDPPAPSVTVKGDGFDQSSTDSPAKFDSIPVGTYRISAAYPWLAAEQQAEVTRGESKRVEFRPKVGVVEISTEPKDATFSLSALGGNGVTMNGWTPSTVRLLPIGEYRLRASRGDYLKESRIEVKAGETNRVKVAFEYGQVQLISDPPGAAVFDGDQQVGTTPKVFAELKPGDHRYRLELEGYQGATLVFSVDGKEPLTLRTNLIHVGYATAMREARSLAAARDLTKALVSVAKALEAKPGDEAATALKSELDAAQQSAAATEAEQQRTAELDQRRAKIAENYKQTTEGLKDGALFDTHTWKAKGPMDRVVTAIKRTFDIGQARWEVEKQVTLDDQGVRFDCKAKGGFLARRRCVIMANPVKDDEVIVQGKFWDYVLSNSIDVFGTNNWIPMHPSRVQGNPGEIEGRRKVLPELFGRILQAELGR